MNRRAGEDAEFSKTHWDRKKARLDYERALFRFEVEKEKYLPLNETTVAVGQMLVGFRTALNMLPSSAARWLVGLRDFHQIKDKLQSEVDAVLNSLGRCDYLKTEAVEVKVRLRSSRAGRARCAYSTGGGPPPYYSRLPDETRNAPRPINTDADHALAFAVLAKAGLSCVSHRLKILGTESRPP